MDDLGLILFDVDGTLVDSQSEILSAMSDAFAAISRPTPSREMILSTVGLSLDQAMMRLLPDGTDLAVITRAILAYKNSYRTSREAGALSVIYPGIATMLAECAQHSNWLLGLATGKSRRGVSALIDHYGWKTLFQTIQTADDHPSKPNPSMVHAALAQTGVLPDRCIFVGDTTHDMDMATNAGVRFIGVSWGYHSPSSFDSAYRVAESPQSVYLAAKQWLEC